MNRVVLHKMRVVVFVACLLSMGCVLFQSWQTTYLKKAVNHATKDEVIQHMGTPRESSKANTGGSVLLYRFKEYQAGDLNGPGRWWCEDYQLRFDEKEILRRWNERDCSRVYNFPPY